MNVDLRGAEREITEMEKCCGCCVCPWRRARNFESSKQYRQGFANRGKADAGASKKAGKSRGDVELGAVSRPANGDFIKRVTNDAREDEMNENIGAAADVLGELRQQALDMGAEIERQDQTLDRLANKADSNSLRIREANSRATRLL